jgi:alpha-1,2-glucosyltransferase
MYSDAWALCAVLATHLCVLRGRFRLAGLAGLAAVLLRQDAIAWVALAALWAAFPADRSITWLRAASRVELRAAIGRSLPLLVVILLFAAFVALNGGVAAGDRRAHESGINLTNVYVLLLYTFVLFLPFCLAAMQLILPLLRRSSVLVALCVAFPLYAMTYANRHPYNQNHLWWFLHNMTLHLLTSSARLRAAAFIPMAWAALMAIATRFPDPRHRWLLWVAPLAAALHPLVEPRYYIPGMVLFTLLRTEATDRVENAALALNIFLSVLLMVGTVAEWFFV